MNFLESALVRCLREALDNSSDKFIRVGTRAKLPLVGALGELANDDTKLLVGALDNWYEASLADSNLEWTSDANMLTRLRNQSFETRGRAIILLGNARGPSQSGLRDLRTVIEIDSICDAYEEFLVDYLAQNLRAGDLRIRTELVHALISLARQRKMTLHSIELYLQSALDVDDGAVHRIHENLWRLRLCPDERFVSVPSMSGRIDFNLATLESLRDDYEMAGPKSRRLASSNRPKVQAFVRWLESNADGDLAQAELNEVLDALRTGPPNTSTRTPDVLEVLANADMADRGEILWTLADELTEDELCDDRLNRTFRTPIGFRIRVHGTSGENDPWTLHTYADDGSILGDGQAVSVVEVVDHGGRVHRTEIRELSLRRMLGGIVADDVLQEFFTARALVLKHFSLLASDSYHSLTLLVSSPTVLTRCAAYIEAWKSLLRVFLDAPSSSQKENLGIQLGLIDGIWTRDLEHAEDAQNPVTHKDNDFKSARLLPIHPWRLGPLVELAQQILNRYQEEPNFVGSAMWALDRAIPTFRVLQVGQNALEHATVVSGFMEFSQTVDNALPPISVPGSLLGRAIRSFAEINPWSKTGATVAYFNAPAGGILESLSEEISSPSSFGHAPAAIVVRDKTTRGLDREANVPEKIISYDVPDLKSWLIQNPVERDVTLFFMAGMRGRSVELGLGAYGTIDLVLASKGFDRNGASVNVPQLKLAPEPDNEVVSLLRSVGGSDEVKAAVFNLTLPATVEKVIPYIATSTGWLIVGAPAFISAFEILDSAGQELYRLAEFDEGSYRFFVFSSSIESLGEVVRDTVEQLPIATERLSRIKEIVNGLTTSNPQKIFDIALNRFGPQEALGLMCARSIAASYIKREALTLEISLDNVSISKEWFDRRDQRADLILVSFLDDPDAEVPIEILVVEAKADSTSSFERPRSNVAPFDKAISQVSATRALLERLFESSDEGLVEALQLRTLIEQLAARAGSEYLHDERPDRDLLYGRYFKLISGLSQRGSVFPSIRTLVCTTYLGGVQNAQILEDSEMTLASVSSKLLEEVLGERAISEPEVQRVDDVTLPQQHSNRTINEVSAETGPDAGSAPIVSTPMSQNSQEIGDLVNDLSRALRLRSESVLRGGDISTSIGPTFLSISFPFERGAQIGPLQRADRDIARDLGVSSVEIANSSEIGRIQVLVPRPDRQFPPLVLGDQGIVDESKYLSLQIGQTLAGETFRSHLSSWPHALISGTTGSGKTTFMRSLLGQLNNWGKSVSQAIIVDGKGETDYFGILDASMFVPEYPEPLLEVNQAVDVLTWLKDVEVPRRKEMIRDIASQRQTRVDAKALFIDSVFSGDQPVIRPLVVVIDEFNELMIRGGQSKTAFVDGVTSVAQAARSVLVHLVLATQRPDRTVVPGTIKANLPVRVAFRLPTAADSVTVLGHGGAEKLLGLGDMLFQLNGEEDRRLQSFIFN